MVVGGGQLALRETLQCPEGGLDPGLRADDVVDDFLALILGQLQRREHLQVGAHRGQGRPQLVGGYRREVTCRCQRGLGAVLLFPDALQHSVDGVGDLDRLGGPANLDIRCLVAGVDLAGLLRQSLEGSHRERREQPAQHRRRPDREHTDDQHPPVQVVGVGDGRVVRRADRHRHRFGNPNLDGADPVAHSADVGVGVAGLQLGKHHLRVRGLLAVGGAHRDDGILVVGRRRDLVESAGQERDREAGGLVETAVQAFLAVVGDADPHHGADDDDDDRRADRGGERDAGAQRRRASENPGQRDHQSLFFAQALTTASYCCLRTNPTPRTVCSSRGAPLASSLRRR